MSTRKDANGPRIAIDVGGTFTDFALVRPSGVHISKVLTTTGSPEVAVIEGLTDLLAGSDVLAADVEWLVHGTTLATNAVISRTGARTALLTTEGFRDVLAVGDESRFDQFDLSIEKPQPLVPRQWRFPVRERLLANGQVLVPLDLSHLDEVAESLRSEEISSLAICFLHSHVNPVHEQAAQEYLRKLLPDLHISISAEVSPEIGEYERFSTTTVNAYVRPVIRDYLQRLKRNLRELGFSTPIFMYLSNGGLCHIDTAQQFPVRLVESGPAGGAMFASYIARQADEKHVLALDMGGTTAKVCVIDRTQPGRIDRFEMDRAHMFRAGSGIPVRIPVVDLVEIGAGGGSIASVDSLKRLNVGPESAGSDPGPACYNRNGQEPTVTDADLVLGRLSPADFDTSGIQVSADLAEAAVKTKVATLLGLSATNGAHAIAEMVEEQMGNAAREHAREKGSGLHDRTIIAFGGAAPLHAAHVATKLGIRHVIVPKYAGIGSAVGFLVSPFSFELSQSVSLKLPLINLDEFNRTTAELISWTRDMVRDAISDRQFIERRFMAMRYVGQAHSLEIELPSKDLTADDSKDLESRFHDTYRSKYKRPMENIAVEGVNISVRLSLETEIELPGLDNLNDETEMEASQQQLRFFDSETNQYAQINSYSREKLEIGQRVAGPALIKEYGTTTVVPPEFVAARDRDGNLHLTRG